jgi:alkylated DNA repair dioxygenase AlkB
VIVAAASPSAHVVGRTAPGFRLLEHFVDPVEHAEIVDWIQLHFRWTERRRGPVPPAEDFPNQRTPLPAWATTIARRLVDAGIFAEPPPLVHIRRYERGRGLHPHIDSDDYGATIAGLTLSSSRVMELTRPRRRRRMAALLLPGSVYVLHGDARHKWMHSIPAVSNDYFRGASYARTDGFSATWRSERAD